jgi:hypothetical protein
MANTCEMEMRGLTDPELNAVSGGQFQLLGLNTLSKGVFGLFQLGHAHISIANSFNTTTQSGENIAVVSGNTNSTINITENIYNYYMSC